MDYEEDKRKGEMSKTSFIFIIVLCLLAIGAVSYLAISGMSAKVKDDDNTSSKNKTYSSNDSSYNSSITEPDFDMPEPSSSVGKTESEIPYEAEDSSESKKDESPNFMMPVDGNIIKGFSDSSLQYSATYSDMRLHTGIDIACKTGTDIKSATDGTVVSVEESATLGRVISVQYSDEFIIKYCGFESLNVKEGEEVKCGTVLGTSGTIPSEANDQPHIHIELYNNNQAVSPLDVLGLN